MDDISGDLSGSRAFLGDSTLGKFKEILDSEGGGIRRVEGGVGGGGGGLLGETLTDCIGSFLDPSNEGEPIGVIFPASFFEEDLAKEDPEFFEDVLAFETGAVSEMDAV